MFSAERLGEGVGVFSVENWHKSHKPVEIGDLRPCDPLRDQRYTLRVQPGAESPPTGRKQGISL